MNYCVRNDLIIDVLDVNILFVEIEKIEMNTTRNVIIGVCYRPPHVHNIDFLEKFDELLSKLHTEKKHIYISGDFNYNTLNLSPASSKIANDFQNMLLSFSFAPLIDEPTREVNDSFSLISNIYTNVPYYFNICKSAILKPEPKISDHHAIICFTNYKYKPVKEKYINKRVFNKKSMAKFSKSMKNQSWDYIYHSPDAQSMFSYFQNQCIYMFEECFPEKNIKITYNNRLPWITNGLRASIIQKTYSKIYIYI